MKKLHYQIRLSCVNLIFANHSQVWRSIANQKLFAQQIEIFEFLSSDQKWKWYKLSEMETNLIQTRTMKLCIYIGDIYVRVTSSKVQVDFQLGTLI